MSYLTPAERAKRAAAAMWEGDEASAWFGMELLSVDEGRARLSMTIRPHHLNGHNTGHGGVTFALADSAFAFACNSRNRASVGQHTSMSYLAPAFEGDVLTADAREVALSGRSGIYDVTVTNQNGSPIAEFRGISRTVKGQHFQEDTE